MFGFKKTPKRGKLFNIFVKKSTLEKENFIIKELTLLSMTDIVETIKGEDIDEELKLNLIIGISSDLFIIFFQMKYFQNSPEFLRFLKKGIEKYSSQTFPDSFISRAKEYLDDSIIESLILGSAFLSAINFSENGLVFDRKILANNIQIKEDNEKFIFSLNDKDELKIFTKFAGEIINC